MGAETFFTRARGATAQEAFSDARRSAQYEHGHGGYTGTIAEKTEFTMIEVPLGEPAVRFADRLLADDDARIRDKWGPAGCIRLGDDEYLFFGNASS